MSTRKVTEKRGNLELQFLNCYISLSVAAGHGLVEKESPLFRRKFTIPSCRHFPYILNVTRPHVTFHFLQYALSSNFEGV